MKYLLIGLLLVSVRGHAQSFETEQLLLDIQKLTQEKQILDDLYKSYAVLDKGYSAIRDISKGNFDLHKAYLDGLLVVSSAVKSYPRVTDILTMQQQTVNACSAGQTRFVTAASLTSGERSTLTSSYADAMTETENVLNALSTVLTDGKLRANDGERLQQIDQLYSSMWEQWLRIRRMNIAAEWLIRERAAAAGDNQYLKQLYHLK